MEFGVVPSHQKEGILLSKVIHEYHNSILGDITYYIICGKHSLWNLRVHVKTLFMQRWGIMVIQLWKHHSNNFLGHEAIHHLRFMVTYLPTLGRDTHSHSSSLNSKLSSLY